MQHTPPAGSSLGARWLRRGRVRLWVIVVSLGFAIIAALSAAWFVLTRPMHRRRRRRRAGATPRLLFASRAKASQEYGRIRIRGPRGFIRSTLRALQLLQQHDPEALALVERHLVGIWWVPIDFFGAWVEHPWQVGGICFVGRPLARRITAVSYAGVLAHEAYHCELTRIYQRVHGWWRPVPRDVYTGATAEQAALAYQCDVLKRLGEPPRAVERYQRRLLRSRWWEQADVYGRS